VLRRGQHLGPDALGEAHPPERLATAVTDLAGARPRRRQARPLGLLLATARRMLGIQMLDRDHFVVRLRDAPPPDLQAYEKQILDHVRKTNPWLLVLGRIGVHSPKEERALGSNVENILRCAPCDVLLSTRQQVPAIDVRAEETIRWTPEAEARMKNVPEQVKGIARTGVLRLALEKGHSVITSAVIDDAMDRFMPKSASAATKALAEAVALERAKSGPVSMCRACGVTATQSDPVKCTVCGASDFEVISPEMIEKIAAVEGGLQEETTYDGRKLRWSEDARKGLWTMKNAYQRRRVKARVEKRARMMKLDAITLEFARQVIEEETGTPLEIAVHSPDVRRAGRAEASAEAGGTSSSSDPKLIGRDERKNPLISTFDWTSDAAQRILRLLEIPAPEASPPGQEASRDNPATAVTAHEHAPRP